MVEARFKTKLQLFCGDEIALGPGKADLLDAIRAHGSISAAARAMNMSYRRAWLMVDVMKRCWTQPLVETKPEGSERSGARVTAFGEHMLDLYRRMQAQQVEMTRSATACALEAGLCQTPAQWRLKSASRRRSAAERSRDRE